MPPEIFDPGAEDSSHQPASPLATGRRSSRSQNQSTAMNTDEVPFYDPTAPDLLRTRDGSENPRPEPFGHIAGSRHPQLSGLNVYLSRPEPGSITLPCTIPLVNRDADNPLQRSAVYGVDLTLQSQERSTHTLVTGLTGAGKNQRVIDPLRASALLDPAQTVVSFSLKAGDYGMVRELCRRSGKRLVVWNPGNPYRSATWNPLSTSDPDTARDLIRRFCDASRNLQSHDSEFWTQWIRCGMEGCWHQGMRSFPQILQFFAQPYRDVSRQLQQHNNPGSRRLADFLSGGSQNAETAMACILGTLTSLLAQSTLQVLSGNELNLQRIFRRPICLHVEIPEPRLETYRPLIQMLARCVIDSLICTAEQQGLRRRVPATLFFDDLPSLGPLLSVERLLTMRSRGVGIVAGVQSINSLELAYGNTSRALLEAFSHKVVLPGCAQPDADYFSHASGESFVALPTYDGQPAAFANRPLLSPSDIRQPEYQHPNLGRPATLFFQGGVFQAYLQQAFELPQFRSAIHIGRNCTGYERLRRKPPQPAEPQCHMDASTSLTDTTGWDHEQLKSHVLKLRETAGWARMGRQARQWWTDIQKQQGTQLREVVRILEELQRRGMTLTTFYEVSQKSGTDDLQANLLFLDYIQRRIELDREEQWQDPF